MLAGRGRGGRGGDQCVARRGDGDRRRRTRIQSGRLGPQPRHFMRSRRHVLHESPSRSSSHFWACEKAGEAGA